MGLQEGVDLQRAMGWGCGFQKGCACKGEVDVQAGLRMGRVVRGVGSLRKSGGVRGEGGL